MATAAAGGKRERTDTANGGSAAKRAKDSESYQTGVGSKSKPCTKFFSTSGCPFGEGCHFLHFVPGGYQAAAQLTNVGNHALGPAPSRMGSAVSAGPPTPIKSKMCNKYNTAEGCKWGDKCHFAHGERELGRPVTVSHEFPMGPPMGHGPIGHYEPPPMADMGAPGNFGTSATAKISVDAHLAGAIIGKGGVNTKQICRVTGAKLAIRDHESDTNLKNIELEGTFDQIKRASAMVKELIYNISNAVPSAINSAAGGYGRGAGNRANNFKTKLCDNFTKGSCTFGEKCHFAHGEEELRKPAV